jgi:hypothetical protein
MKSYQVNKWSLNLKFNGDFESYLHLILFYPLDQKLGQRQKKSAVMLKLISH